MKAWFKNVIGVAMAVTCSSSLLFAPSAQADLFYQISGKDLTQPSYLYGTMHMLCQDDFYIDPSVTEAFAKTEQLVLEIDLTDPALAQVFQQHSAQPDAQYLRKFLNAEQHQQMNQYFVDNLGADLTQIGHLRPFILTSLLLPMQLNCQQQASYDGYFAEQAQLGGHTIAELETPLFQLDLFNQVPVAEQVNWLWDMISDPASSQAEMQKLNQLYIQGDADKLYAYTVAQPEFAEYEALLLSDRNRDWVVKLPQMMATKPSFIAVGAGHLGGDQGVVALLREAGYQVQAIKVERPTTN
ncbi:MAG: TraB/GumN family protein [Pseudidiomarina maritima]|nr:TraB/GumN family protein [Pseudidiomarina maritima]